jgi:hypothetical protein
MAHYCIESVYVDSLKEEFGEDVVFFFASIISDEEPPHRFSLVLPYSNVISHASELYPVIPSFLENARNQISGWGPQESKLLDELGECGFDVTELARKAFESSFDFEKEALRIENQIKTAPVELESIADELQETISAVKEETVTYYSLCELLESVISNAVVDRFPIIVNSSSDRIRELKEILLHRIPELAGDLADLIKEAGEDQ